MSPVHQRQSTQRQTETTSTVSFQLALYTHFNRYMQAYTQGQTDGQTDRQTNRRTETTSTVSFHLALLYTFQHIHLETDRQTQAETQTDRRKDTHGDRQTEMHRHEPRDEESSFEVQMGNSTLFISQLFSTTHKGEGARTKRWRSGGEVSLFYVSK